MLRKCSLFVLSIVAMLTACSTSREGRRQLSLVSEEDIYWEGVRSFERIKNRHVLAEDERETKNLKCIVNALVKNESGLSGDWEIAILLNDQPNAFALPGRKIAVNSGLLRVAVNQDQLAAVIAHEIAHIQAGHSAETASHSKALDGLSLISRFAGIGWVHAASSTALDGAKTGLYFPMSRIQEEEADLIGVELMARGGFNPNEVLNFWENMQVYGDVGSESFFSTHPTHLSRIAKLEERIARRGWSDVDQKERPKCGTH